MATGAVAEDTKSRLLAMALKLFREHGVEGTSLQMIADELGVTKAAVYYHFKTKDEIAGAVAEPALRELERIMDEAATLRRHGAQVDRVLDGLIDLIVRHRELLALFHSDPGLMRVVDRYSAGSVDVSARMISILCGPEPDLSTTVAVHIALAGIAMTGGAPAMSTVDDETLRQLLVDVGRKLLGRPRRR
jgi:AcrR family transcriptional regulator